MQTIPNDYNQISFNAGTFTQTSHYTIKNNTQNNTQNNATHPSVFSSILFCFVTIVGIVLLCVDINAYVIILCLGILYVFIIWLLLHIIFFRVRNPAFYSYLSDVNSFGNLPDFMSV